MRNVDESKGGQNEELTLFITLSYCALRQRGSSYELVMEGFSLTLLNSTSEFPIIPTLIS
jgi:hypothetical protein